MPVNVVKTERDEHLWEKAKQIASENGQAENWPYVMGIYKKMQGTEKTAGLLNTLTGKNILKAKALVEEGEKTLLGAKAKQQETSKKLADAVHDFESRNKGRSAGDIARVRREYADSNMFAKPFKRHKARAEERAIRKDYATRKQNAISPFEESANTAARDYMDKADELKNLENAVDFEKKKTFRTRLGAGALAAGGVGLVASRKKNSGAYVEPNYDVDYQPDNYMYMTASEYNDFLEKYAALAAKGIANKVLKTVFNPNDIKTEYILREAPYTFKDRFLFRGVRDAVNAEKYIKNPKKTPISPNFSVRADAKISDVAQNKNVLNGQATDYQQAMADLAKRENAGFLQGRSVRDMAQDYEAKFLKKDKTQDEKEYLKGVLKDKKRALGEKAKVNDAELENYAKTIREENGNYSIDFLNDIERHEKALFDKNIGQEHKRLDNLSKVYADSYKDYNNSMKKIRRERNNELVKSLGLWAIPAVPAAVGGKKMYDKHHVELGKDAYYNVVGLEKTASEKYAEELGRNAYYAVIEKEAGVLGTAMKFGGKMIKSFGNKFATHGKKLVGDIGTLGNATKGGVSGGVALKDAKAGKDIFKDLGGAGAVKSIAKNPLTIAGGAAAGGIATGSAIQKSNQAQNFNF